jgi:hypothetical protein
MSTITREWLQQTIAEYEANRDELPFGLDTNSAIELQAFKLALASLEAEPVSVPDERYRHLSDIYHAQEKRLFKLAQRIKGSSFDKYAHSTSQAIDVLESAIFGDSEDACRAAMLQGADERHVVRSEHAEWSQSTFGDVGPIGPLKHLSKEALEAAAEPGDLSEWADMQFLLWDAQRRVGITDEQITLAMIEKLAVNKARTWPEPKDGEPRLHIKAAPQQGVK